MPLTPYLQCSNVSSLIIPQNNEATFVQSRSFFSTSITALEMASRYFERQGVSVVFFISKKNEHVIHCSWETELREIELSKIFFHHRLLYNYLKISVILACWLKFTCESQCSELCCCSCWWQWWFLSVKPIFEFVKGRWCKINWRLLVECLEKFICCILFFQILKLMLRFYFAVMVASLALSPQLRPINIIFKF